MRPEELLPRKRTLSSGSRVPPAVTRTRTPSHAGPLAPGPGRAAPARGARAIAASHAASSSGGSARRPTPCSPLEASLPTPGSTISTPRSRSVCTLARVAGCSYMSLFIAGATTSGQRALRAHAVSRLSAIPAASLAIVFALAGAMTYTSALATSARWPIGSCSGSG